MHGRVLPVRDSQSDQNIKISSVAPLCGPCVCHLTVPVSPLPAVAGAFAREWAHSWPRPSSVFHAAKSYVPCIRHQRGTHALVGSRHAEHYSDEVRLSLNPIEVGARPLHDSTCTVADAEGIIPT